MLNVKHVVFYTCFALLGLSGCRAESNNVSMYNSAGSYQRSAVQSASAADTTTPILNYIEHYTTSTPIPIQTNFKAGTGASVVYSGRDITYSATGDGTTGTVVLGSGQAFVTSTSDAHFTTYTVFVQVGAGITSGTLSGIGQAVVTGIPGNYNVNVQTGAGITTPTLTGLAEVTITPIVGGYTISVPKGADLALSGAGQATVTGTPSTAYVVNVPTGAGVTTPSLQQVTDVGNTTNRSVSVGPTLTIQGGDVAGDPEIISSYQPSVGFPSINILARWDNPSSTWVLPQNVSTGGTLKEGAARVSIPSRQTSANANLTITPTDSAGTSVFTVVTGAGLTTPSLQQAMNVGNTTTKPYFGSSVVYSTGDVVSSSTVKGLDGTFTQSLSVASVIGVTSALFQCITAGEFDNGLTVIGSLTENSKRIVVPDRLSISGGGATYTPNNAAGTGAFVIPTGAGVTTPSLQQVMAVGHTTTFSYDSTNYVAATRDIMTSGTFRGRGLSIADGNGLIDSSGNASFGPATIQGYNYVMTGDGTVSNMACATGGDVTGNFSYDSLAGENRFYWDQPVYFTPAGTDPTDSGQYGFFVGDPNLGTQTFYFQDNGWHSDSAMSVVNRLGVGTATAPSSGAYVQSPNYAVTAEHATSTAYSITSSDGQVYVTGAGLITLTINPANFTSGQKIHVYDLAVGAVTITSSSGTVVFGRTATTYVLNPATDGSAITLTWTTALGTGKFVIGD